MIRYYFMLPSEQGIRGLYDLTRFDAILTGLLIISDKALSVNAITNWCALAQLTPYE